ncbi:MAG: hypothetical protein COB26_10555 [Piscirickettsiaceae bacterium]|nr:MAG: hypothetical protein COB26_10555 [Piscirickettsiaceae bacterium]
MQLKWDDIRYLVLLARHGRMNMVAKEVGVNVTTVSRRLKSLEETLGTKLFTRVDHRYYPTDPLQHVLAKAESAEREISYFQHELMEQDAALQGRLRITSIHNFINFYLLPRLNSFYERYPMIELELIADSEQLDLTRYEADIAIRMGRPNQQSIVTRRLSKLYYSLYVHKSLFSSERSIEEMPWVLYEERFNQLPEARWQRENFPDVKANLYCNVGPAMLSAVQNKLGIAFLPCYMAHKDQNLICLQEPIVLRDLWTLVHPDRRHLAKIRVFLEWLDSQVNSDKVLFKGDIQLKF